MIFDAEDAFVHPSERERSEVYVPEPLADFFEPDVFARQRVGDADPLLLPANAAVATDEPDFEVSGVFEGRESPRQLALGRSIQGKQASLDATLRAGGRRYIRVETD